jgi:hypothetical protein
MPLLPSSRSDFCEFPLAAAVLEAAVKYEMEEAIRIMRSSILRFVGSKPLQVYALACRLELRGEASAAAKSWRQKCPKVYSIIENAGALPNWSATAAYASYIPGISAGAYFRLLQFVRTGKHPGSFLQAGSKSNPAVVSTENAVPDDSHPFCYDDADVVLRSLDGIDFRVHKVIISLASAGILDKKPIIHGTSPLPVIQLPEDGRTLVKLLQLCYPVTDPDPMKPYITDAVLHAAVKYKITRGMQQAKMQWLANIEENPLPVYFTAVCFGWKEEAREAANWVARRRLEDVYVPQMEFISADAYYSLLKYCHSYHSAVVAVASNYEKKENETWREEFSSWWYEGIKNRATPLTSIAAPIVQRELRVVQQSRRYSQHGFQSSNTLIREIMLENLQFSIQLQEKLSTVGELYHIALIDELHEFAGEVEDRATSCLHAHQLQR